MIERPTDDQLAKLPKYVQEYIRDIERQRDNAVKVMKKAVDDQTPTKVWTDDFEYIGEDRGGTLIARYFKCEQLTIESAGVRLRIDGLWNDDEIRLSWGPAGSLSALGDVLFIPASYQQAILKSLEKGRK